MTYRLITVWRDEESDAPSIQRLAKDYSTIEEIDTFILAIKDQGIIMHEFDVPPMENGFNLIRAYVPFHQVVSFHIWLIPDGESQEAHLDNH